MFVDVLPKVLLNSMFLVMLRANMLAVKVGPPKAYQVELPQLRGRVMTKGRS